MPLKAVNGVVFNLHGSAGASCLSTLLHIRAIVLVVDVGCVQSSQAAGVAHFSTGPAVQAAVHAAVLDCQTRAAPTLSLQVVDDLHIGRQLGVHGERLGSALAGWGSRIGALRVAVSLFST